MNTTTTQTRGLPHLPGNLVLTDVLHERMEQLAKWGPQDRPSIPRKSSNREDFTMIDLTDEVLQKELTEQARLEGDLSWAQIAAEEFAEAFTAATRNEPTALYDELVQLAAVVVAWAENVRMTNSTGGVNPLTGDVMNAEPKVVIAAKPDVQAEPLRDMPAEGFRTFEAGNYGGPDEERRRIEEAGLDIIGTETVREVPGVLNMAGETIFTPDADVVAVASTEYAPVAEPVAGSPGETYVDADGTDPVPTMNVRSTGYLASGRDAVNDHLFSSPPTLGDAYWHQTTGAVLLYVGKSRWAEVGQAQSYAGASQFLASHLHGFDVPVKP